MSSLRFGRNGEITWDAEHAIRLAESTTLNGQPLSSVRDAVKHAVSEPIDFPPLSQIVLSDDTVVIPLQPGLPCVADLVAGAVDGLMDAGVPPELIRILKAPHDTVSPRQLLSSLDSAIAGRLTVTEHNPEIREQLSFLGASKQDHAIYINREIGDAGFVLPIGFQGVSTEIYSGWFPTFSDKETQTRFPQNDVDRFAEVDRRSARRM